MDVPIFRLKYDKEYRNKFYQHCEKIFDKAFLSNDDFVLEFEKQFSTWTGAREAIAVNNGTAALEALFRAINIKDKQVIVTTNTFIATASAIINAGGIPVLADIEKDYASLDPQRVLDLITDKTKAIVTVHIGGLISPSIIDLQKICEDKGLYLVEDCAHAHGSSFQNKHCGLFGVGGTFSFFTTKVLTTGEGGMVITNSKEIKEQMVSIRQFGKEHDNPISHFQNGNNLKMSEFIAALGLVEMEYAEKKIQQRQKIAQIYQDKLSSTIWNPMKPHPESVCTHYKQILWPSLKRQEIEQYLFENKVQLTGGVYNIPLHRQPLFKKDYNDADFPIANNFSENHLCPPCYADLSESQAGTACQLLLEYKY